MVQDAKEVAVKRIAVGYEYLCRIVMMIAVAHIAWLAHTLLGLVVYGLFPSTAALYGTYRSWLLDVEDRSWTVKRTWITFHRIWVEERNSANLFGWPQALIWVLLIWEYWLVQHNDMGVIGIGVSGALLVLNIFYGLFVLLSWAVRANFDEKPMWVVRTSLSMVVARPLCSLMVVCLFMLTLWAYYTWPGLAVAFGFAVPVFATMMAVYSWGRMPGMDVHVLEPKDAKSSDERSGKRAVNEAGQ